MTDHLTLTGTIGTDPEYRIDANGLARTSFRLVTNERRRDADGTWADVHANWYRITCFSRLAANAQASLRKGERVVVTGRLRLRDFERGDGTEGTSAEITASALGHDLAFATTTASRTGRADSAASDGASATPASLGPASTDRGGTGTGTGTESVFAPSESVQALLGAPAAPDASAGVDDDEIPGPPETLALAFEGTEPPF